MSTMRVLVGMIASGKSTYARKRAEQGDIIINDDSVVESVHGGNYMLYSKELKHLYKGVENAMLHLAVASGRNVVVDIGRCVSDSARRRWIAAAKSLDIDVVAVMFPKENARTHALRRFHYDDRRHGFDYWFEVARHHASIYTCPTMEEGFARVWTVGVKEEPAKADDSATADVTGTDSAAPESTAECSPA